MNKDKAIQLLERLQDPEPYEPMLTKDAYDAIQMAIDALSADGDTISRKAAIEAINKALDRQTLLNCFVRKVAIDAIKQLPPAHPEPSQVAADIARIVENGQDMRVIEAAQHTPDQNGDLWITVPDIDKVTCIYVQESKSKFCRTFYEEQEQPAQPKRGKWEMGIDERFVECSECGLMTTRNELRGLAVFGKNEPNFCPNCGAEMEVNRMSDLIDRQAAILCMGCGVRTPIAEMAYVVKIWNRRVTT